jgi:hypothetical protein
MKNKLLLEEFRFGIKIAKEGEMTQMMTSWQS